MSPRRLLFSAAALFLLAVFIQPSVALAQASDVIRGRITGPDTLPIERATVTATSLNGNITRTARTDKAGRYQIVFPGDEGDYMINVAALGYAAKKFEIKRTGDQEILVADARLAKSATQLDAVKVQAQRDKPIRDDNRADIGGSERTVNTSALSADQLGDLAALAASMPGVQLIQNADGSSGFSVLGLGADQNSLTLNGMPFGGGAIPRDANVSTTLATSPYDVSRGNFSGGLLSIKTGRASNFIVRSGSANIDAPSWSVTSGAVVTARFTSNMRTSPPAASLPVRFSPTSRSSICRISSAAGRAIFRVYSTPVLSASRPRVFRQIQSAGCSASSAERTFRRACRVCRTIAIPIRRSFSAAST